MTAYEIVNLVLSLVAVGISIYTVFWTIYYRGKLEWHLYSAPEGKGDYFCIIVNSGQKPITPFQIGVYTTKEKTYSLIPIEGEKALEKLLQPGEILRLTFRLDMDFEVLVKEAKEIILVDAYKRSFPLDKKEVAAIQTTLL